MESSKKWFQFSREIFGIAKKHMKDDKIKLLEKYDTFFMGNMDEHI